MISLFMNLVMLRLGMYAKRERREVERMCVRGRVTEMGEMEMDRDSEIDGYGREPFFRTQWEGFITAFSSPQAALAMEIMMAELGCVLASVGQSHFSHPGAIQATSPTSRN